MRTKRGLTILGALAPACAWLFAIGVPAASAADVNKEVSTAAQHAGFAASSKDMKTTQMHLHHVVNCWSARRARASTQASATPAMAKVLARFRIPRIAPRRHPCSKPFSRPSMASSNPTWLLVRRTRPLSRFF